MSRTSGVNEGTQILSFFHPFLSFNFVMLHRHQSCSFEKQMAIEDKQGISRLEQVVEEISEAERAKELKKEHKRLKKKKRKENKCKFANEMAEKKNSLKKENEHENGETESGESKSIVAFEEEKPKCDAADGSKMNGVRSCEEISNGKNSVDSTQTEKEIVNENVKERSGTGGSEPHSDSPSKESCLCGDDAKENSGKKNGFVNASDEKPRSQYKKSMGLSPNGYVMPPSCRSCGQQLSPTERYDRGRPDRGKEAAGYPDICAKCAAMNSDGGNRKNRKKVNKSKEVCSYDVCVSILVFFIIALKSF